MTNLSSADGQFGVFGEFLDHTFLGRRLLCLLGSHLQEKERNNIIIIATK